MLPGHYDLAAPLLRGLEAAMRARRLSWRSKIGDAVASATAAGIVTETISGSSCFSPPLQLLQYCYWSDAARLDCEERCSFCASLQI